MSLSRGGGTSALFTLESQQVRVQVPVRVQQVTSAAGTRGPFGTEREDSRSAQQGRTGRTPREEPDTCRIGALHRERQTQAGVG